MEIINYMYLWEFVIGLFDIGEKGDGGGLWLGGKDSFSKENWSF